MIDKIYTYKDPRELKGLSIWGEIKDYPHLCVSQTLVEGMKEYYGRDQFLLINTVDTFLKKLFKEWHDSKENIIKQNTAIINIIDRWIDEGSRDTKLANTFRHNRKDVIKAIRYLIESDAGETLLSKRSELNQQEKYLLDIFEELRDRQDFKIDLPSSKKEIDQCYLGVLLEEMKKYSPNNRLKVFEDENEIIEQFDKKIEELDSKICAGENWAKDEVEKLEAIRESYSGIKKSIMRDGNKTDKVIIHGVHQLTPLILKMMKIMKTEGIEVIVLINYMEEYKEIYSTWNQVYGWSGIEFEEFGKTPDGRKFGKVFGDVQQAKLYTSSREHDERYLGFDNLTAFTESVSSVFEKASNDYYKSENYKKNPNNPKEKLIKIALMNEQFYAVNGSEINDQLKIYFPEQFSERHFLTYPIGQFIMGIYDLWNDQNNRIEFNESNIRKVISIDIWEKDGMPTALDIFNNLKVYFKGANTFNEYINRINKLIKISQKKTNEIDKRREEKLSFFRYSLEELEYFSSIVEQIKKISDKIFENKKDRVKENFKKLVDDMKVLMESEDENKLLDIEKEMLSLINDSLQEMKDEGEDTYIKNIKETIGFYLNAKTSHEYKAEWIVRDFEQIDGGILIAAAKEREGKSSGESTSFHFAGVCEESMLGKSTKTLPWPLTSDIYLKIGNKTAEICEITRKEYPNFLKFAFFYGTFFLSNLNEVKISYIKKLGDETYNPYTIINYFMNIPVVTPNVGDDQQRSEIGVKEYELTGIGEIDQAVSDSELRSMRRCEYRYLLNHCLDKDTYFYEDWHLERVSKYFIVYNFIKKYGKELNMNMENLDKKIEEKLEVFKRCFPFFNDSDFIEIKNEIKLKELRADSNRYIDNSMEFIYRKFTEDDRTIDTLEKFNIWMESNEDIECNIKECQNCNQRQVCKYYVRALRDEEHC